MAEQREIKMPQAGRGVICDHCDSRIQVDEMHFHCGDCPDFDLCKRCYPSATTIHPADHSLALLVPRNSEGLGPQCDNCHSSILRVLHFCKSCPNFNICNTCFASASTFHPQSHEFCTIGSPEESEYRCGHCNAIISKFMFVCGDCPSFSICKSCYPSAAEVHPAHSSWTPASLRDDKGRGLQCDSCNCPISGGIFHYCKLCQDFTACNDCFSASSFNHPKDHGFVTIGAPKATGLHCSHCSEELIAVLHHCETCQNYRLCEKCFQLSRTTWIHPVDHYFDKRVSRAVLYSNCRQCDAAVSDVFHRCETCVNYNLCEDCFPSAPNIHSADHSFARLGGPNQRTGHKYRDDFSNLLRGHDAATTRKQKKVEEGEDPDTDAESLSAPTAIMVKSDVALFFGNDGGSQGAFEQFSGAAGPPKELDVRGLKGKSAHFVNGPDSYRSNCPSCTSVTAVLPSLHVALLDPEVLKAIGGKEELTHMTISWPARLPALMQATLDDCPFCAFILKKFFGGYQGDLFLYWPEGPWYAKPSRAPQQRNALLDRCKKLLAQWGDQIIKFYIEPRCTIPGISPPDFDTLRILPCAESKEQAEALKKISAFGRARPHIDVPVYAEHGSPAARHISPRPPNPNPASETGFNQIRSWLTDCEENHGETCKGRTPSALPTRLIDVSGPDSSLLHLKESHAGERGRYTALSYCWGGPQEFRTTKEDLAARIEGFQLKNLPQTLQDAVIVTRELGISYLWVDSMCIVQDDDEDKFREISRMRDIYKEAVLTISASNGKAAKDGFLHDLSDRRTGLWRSMIPLTYCLPNDGATTMKEAFEMPKGEESRLWLLDEDSYLEALFSDPVSSRAWCLQERVLSPRFLDYGRWPKWRCNHGTKSDGGFYAEDMWSGEAERKITAFLLSTFEGHALSLMEMNRLYKSWYALLSHYTKRQMSVETDKLHAIDGIASDISRLTGVPYVVGLWANNLLHDIMWQTKIGLESLSRPKEWRSPTWSWASVNFPISYDIISNDLDPQATIIGYHCPPEATLRLSNDSIDDRPWLQIRGPLLELDHDKVLDLMLSQRMSPAPDMEQDEREWYKKTYQHCAETNNEKATNEEVRELLPGKIFGMVVFTQKRLIEKKNSSQTEEICYSGLLLEEVCDGKFRRIGGFWDEARSLLPKAEFWEQRTIVIV